MFECEECKRTYSSQNSLTRHKHNHGKSREYPCSICNVVFYRADLRARHLNLHKYPAAGEATSSSTQGEGNTLKRRKRCHTACVRCRGLRIKCSSRRPCEACTVTGQRCEFARDINRVSRARISSARESSHSPDETSAQRSPLQHSEQNEYLVPQDASATTSPSPVSGSLGAGATDDNADTSGIDITHGDQTFFILQSGSNEQITSGLPLETSVIPQQTQHLQSFHDMSWPWLHESLFLPSDMFAWPQINSTDASEPRSYPQDFFSPAHEDSLGISHHWGNQSTHVDHLVLGQNYDPATNRPGVQSMPSTSGGLSFGGAHDHHQRASTLWQSEAAQVRESTRLAQSQEISTLVSYASNTVFTSQARSGQNNFWSAMSPKVAVAFGFFSPSSSNILDEFVHLYLDHFGQLWPLLSRQALDSGSFHPLLYLVLTSIGAMYGTAAQSAYGRMMHNAIREPLMLPLEFEDSDNDFLWLAQARLLTQVAALYFGQPKAFSYAQHLGCLLVAQARRLDLFAPRNSLKALEHEKNPGELPSPKCRLGVWLQLESRRRLAFGIFRGDTYTSVLLGIKPLVSPEEIDLELPACDLVWTGQAMEPEVCLLLIDQDRTLGQHLKFSDLYRIAIDQNEPLPALEPPSYELLLFAMQGLLWRFSRDPKMFERLTGYLGGHPRSEGEGISESPLGIRQSTNSDTETHKGGSSVPSFPADHLNDSRRQMADLRHEADKLMSALHKWKQSLSFVKTLARSERERGSLLSSLLLYHLSYMRLHAPMEDLHQIEYQLAEGRSICKSTIGRVYEWADTPYAYIAAQHACHIWELITKEGNMPEKIRAKFNLLAFTGLHHAATVLWSYAGAAQDAKNQDLTPMRRPVLELHSPDPALPSLRICRTETKALLNSFVRLYSVISPARWSSFAKAAAKLSDFQFPVPDN